MLYALAQKARLNPKPPRQSSLSEQNLREGLRENGNAATLADTQTVYPERDGSILVVKQPAQPVIYNLNTLAGLATSLLRRRCVYCGWFSPYPHLLPPA